MTRNSLESKTLPVLSYNSKVATCYYIWEPHYLRGKVWVASGETGHDPDVTSSYQAQGPRFL